MNELGAVKPPARETPSVAPRCDKAPSGERLQASYLTHELRAPVTAIRLGLEILQEQAMEKLAGDEKQLLSLAIKNTARLDGLINDIMDYSKFAAGKMKLEKRVCEGRGLISETVEGMNAWARVKGVRLAQTQGFLPSISAEPGRIIQVLTNLLSNAIKFTPPGGCVTIAAKEGEGTNAGTLIFSVADTGCGIAAKDRESIFDSFNQSARSGKHGEGTGLGLTLARLVVGLHGGRIWVESRLGKGSTFYFTIPILPEDAGRPSPRFQWADFGSGLAIFRRQVFAFMALNWKLRFAAALFALGIGAWTAAGGGGGLIASPAQDSSNLFDEYIFRKEAPR